LVVKKGKLKWGERLNIIKGLGDTKFFEQKGGDRKRRLKRKESKTRKRIIPKKPTEKLSPKKKRTVGEMEIGARGGNQLKKLLE